MAEYIDRDALIKDIDVSIRKNGKSAILESYFRWCVMRQKAADVTEVKRGRWIEGESLEKCSLCGKKGFPDWRYCPNCGAKMDKEEYPC